MSLALLKDLKSLNANERNAFIASFLGWMLDAFDFFIVVFVLKDLAHDFQSSVKDVAYAITLTLALRPLGALLFGWLADRYGRRPVLMADILLFSALELASAFAPNLTVFLVLRALFGIAMGGEWGVGASLALESMPARLRGFASGFLQQGYACGYLAAALVYWLAFPLVGWRGMFVIGVIPALLALYIRSHVEESASWTRRQHDVGNILRAIAGNWKIFLYLILLMTCFNGLSHGTQDLYPTFLQSRGLSQGETSLLSIIANLGAITGGILFGSLSEKFGRKNSILLAALGALAAVYFWIYPSTLIALAAGAFVMQFMVQGAWGIVPAHLNELSPEEIRGTFPGLAYQLGNLLIAMLAPYQAQLAADHHGNYGFALGATLVTVALLLMLVVKLGPERKGAAF